MSELNVQVVSPERVLYSGVGTRVIARAAGGDIAFLAGHAPFIGSLAIGTVRVLLIDGGEQTIAVHGGFVEVGGDHVTVLSDVAELPEQIDVGRAEHAKDVAQRALATADETDAEELKAAIARAEVRIEAAKAASAADA